MPEEVTFFQESAACQEAVEFPARENPVVDRLLPCQELPDCTDTAQLWTEMWDSCQSDHRKYQQAKPE